MKVRQAVPLQQRLKPGIAAQGIEQRADAQADERLRAIVVRALQPFERAVGVAELIVDVGKPERRDVLAACALVELGQNPLRILATPGRARRSFSRSTRRFSAASSARARR